MPDDGAHLKSDQLNQQLLGVLMMMCRVDNESDHASSARNRSALGCCFVIHQKSERRESPCSSWTGRGSSPFHKNASESTAFWSLVWTSLVTLSKSAAVVGYEQ